MKGFVRAVRETIFFWLAERAPRHSFFNKHRWRLLKAAGMKIGRVRISAPFVFTQFGEIDRISIGQDTFVNAGLRIGVGNPAYVSIGRDCAIGPNVSLETNSHHLVWTPENKWGSFPKSIMIEDRCWIGARVVIVGGVTVGTGSVIAAGAVVTRDVEPFSLVGGVPAKLIRKLA